MKTILLTAGSGPFSLGLARLLHRAGHRVLATDCWEKVVCRYSKAVDAFYHVPPPAMATSAWTSEILHIVEAEKVDLVVPVFEEVLYLAQAIDGMPNPPSVFAADFRTLLTLHNKWLFNQHARSLGLTAPESRLLTCRDDVADAFAENSARVFKPVYSRWASNIVVRPGRLEELDNVCPSERQPWLAQDFLPGRPFATYSLAHNGRLTAHTAYASDMSSGYGPTHGYRPVRHPEIFAWVKKLVEATNYTGQIGVDFIEDAEGRAFATECNPRTTGAMYLLADDPRFAASIVDPDAEMIEPASNRARISRPGMCGLLFKRSSSFPGYGTWAKMFFGGKAIRMFQLGDPLPAFAFPYTVAKFAIRCAKEKQDARVLATLEREWSSEPVAESQLVAK